MKHKKWLTVLFIHGNRRRYQVSIWTEENDMMGDNADDNVNDDAANATANENNADANSGADDAALDNGDTMSEGTGDNGTVTENGSRYAD